MQRSFFMGQTKVVVTEDQADSGAAGKRLPGASEAGELSVEAGGRPWSGQRFTVRTAAVRVSPVLWNSERLCCHAAHLLNSETPLRAVPARRSSKARCCGLIPPAGVRLNWLLWQEADRRHGTRFRCGLVEYPCGVFPWNYAQRRFQTPVRRRRFRGAAQLPGPGARMSMRVRVGGLGSDGCGRPAARVGLRPSSSRILGGMPGAGAWLPGPGSRWQPSRPAVLDDEALASER